MRLTRVTCAPYARWDYASLLRMISKHKNTKKMALQKVFVKIEKGTTFTLTPKVEYVELFGKDPNTGTAVYEKFKP